MATTDALEILKYLGLLVGAVVALVTAVAALLRFGPWLMKTLLAGERSARNELITELRARISKLETEAAKVPALEKQLTERDERVDELDKQMTAVCKTVEDLLTWKQTAQSQLDSKQQEIDALRLDKTTLERRNEELVELAKTLTVERNSYKTLIVNRLAKLDSIELAPTPSTDDISEAAKEVMNGTAPETVQEAKEQ